MSHSVTVSASVEMNDGKWCLQIWRGPEALASMTVSSLRVATPYERVIELAPKSSLKVRSPVCFLVFEEETSAFQFLRRICFGAVCNFAFTETKGPDGANTNEIRSLRIQLREQASPSRVVHN